MVADTHDIDSLKRSVQIRLDPDQIWELVVDRDLQCRWLGPKARLPIVRGGRVRVGDNLGVWRKGVLVTVTEGQLLGFRLRPRPIWSAEQGPTELTISLQPDGDGVIAVSVVESGFVPCDTPDQAPLADASLFWERALARLSALAGMIKNRRDHPRQAIVIVHGIGEQEPGTSMEQFVRGVIRTSHQDIEAWTKPDQLSRSFEMRRITLKASMNQVRPTTDIFELYWAHLIRDTTLSQVASWAQGLLLRWPVPRPFRVMWGTFWGAVIGVLTWTLGQVLGLWDLGPLIPAAGIVIGAATWLWKLVGRGAIINSLGDAARYLTPRPANIQNRQAIRTAAVDLLDALHTSGEFDRIVLVGHSLGSVIAYDALTYYWIRVHRRHLRPFRPTFTALRDLERNIDIRDPDVTQRLQFEAWKTIRANTQPWLVTDLITLGSPLAHGDFLLAHGSEQFAQAKADRKLPTSPPVTELEPKTGFKRISYEIPYTDRIDGKDRTFTVLHHAAPFGVTRWTNLYFPSRLFGDPIGGPVARQFGPWVKDVALDPPKRGFVHTYYWRTAKKGDGHLDELRTALRLDCGVDLINLLRQQRPMSLISR